MAAQHYPRVTAIFHARLQNVAARRNEPPVIEQLFQQESVIVIGSAMARQNSITQVDTWRQSVQGLSLLWIQRIPCEPFCGGEVIIRKLLNPPIMISPNSR